MFVYLSFNSDFFVCKIMHILMFMFLRQCIYELEIFNANRTTKCLWNQPKQK